MTATEKRKPGRPSIRTPELVEELFAHLEAGLCIAEVAEIDGMPAVATVYRWQDEDPAFREAYARAVSAGVLQNEAEMLREARRKPEDKVDAAKQRTLVDTLKWRLSKRLPKDFGDKQQVEHSGKVGLEQLLADTAQQKPAES